MILHIVIFSLEFLYSALMPKFHWRQTNIRAELDLTPHIPRAMK